MNKGSQDAMVLSLDDAGNLLWLKTYGGSGAESFFGISMASDASMFLSGNSGSNDGDISGNHGLQDFVVFKLKANDTVVKDTSSCRPIWINNIFIISDTTISGTIADRCGYDSVVVSYHVNILPSGFVQSIPDTVIEAGAPVVLTTQASGSVQWLGPGLSCNTCLNPIVQPVNDTRYVVRTTGSVCEAFDTVTIYIRQKDKLYFPSAFTPNGDGLNDVFKPLVFGNIRQYNFTIYNRWGGVVFQSREPGRGWNGSIAEIKQKSDVFIWVCSYAFGNDHIKVEKGTLLLIR
jgi:gliding motility-associated-like protein